MSNRTHLHQCSVFSTWLNGFPLKLAIALIIALILPFNFALNVIVAFAHNVALALNVVVALIVAFASRCSQRGHSL